MSESVRDIVILGGGTAGWLTAGVLAATHGAGPDSPMRITLVESPEVATIGVGEGTWPSMRDTLRRVGVSETELVRACDATFKQGSQFVGWRDGAGGDRYYHPFVLPHGYQDADLVSGWLAHTGAPFDRLVSVQPRLCEAGRAPKQLSTPEYAAVANYAYHLDATRLGTFLREHCTGRLGVRHVADHMTAVNARDNGDIESLQTRSHGAIPGELFIDCSGGRSLLLGGHFGVASVGCGDILFNDRALALQVRYPRDDVPIACQTISTAQPAGWIWDIGLQARRGVGYVYSGAHADEAAVEAGLHSYVAERGGEVIARNALSFTPGYRRRCWDRNCLAIGLSSGFVEPLEASSLVLVELAAGMLADQMPATRATMDIVARRFNEVFAYRWERIIDFLKLHYVLSRREDSAYWRDHRRAETVPARLLELLELWRYQPPSRYDLPWVEEVFPWASYQYILYGMGFRPDRARAIRTTSHPEACFRETAEIAGRMLAALPGHRQLIDHIHSRGMSRI